MWPSFLKLAIEIKANYCYKATFKTTELWLKSIVKNWRAS